MVKNNWFNDEQDIEMILIMLNSLRELINVFTLNFATNYPVEDVGVDDAIFEVEDIKVKRS